MANPEVLEAAFDQSRRWVTLYAGEFKSLLEEKGWRTDEIAFAETGCRVLWGSAAREGPQSPIAPSPEVVVDSG